MENGNQFRNRRPYSANQQWNQDNEDYNYRQQDRGGFNRVNYIPDNDDNRGAYSSDYGYQGGSEADRYGNTSYGKQYYEERDRNQRNMQAGTGNMYGNDYGRRDYGRSQLGSNYGSSGSSFQNQGYGTSADQYRSDFQRRSSYGRDYNNDYNQRSDRDWWDRTRDKVASWFGDDDADRRRNMDQQYQGGSYRGKGPKDYQRSTDRIREDVCERLSYDDRVDASNIEVQVEGNEVVLTGTVHSKAEKRRAEDVAESIMGVRNVENRLRVDKEASSGTDTWSSSIGI